MAGVLNDLGQTILPSVFGSLNTAGLVDTMTITAETAPTIGTGGERIKGTPTNAYTSVPVSYEPLRQGRENLLAGDKAIDSHRYILTFPTHTAAGARINLNPATQRLVVNARPSPGDEPAKTFRIIGVGDVSGVVYEVVCTKEG